MNCKERTLKRRISQALEQWHIKYRKRASREQLRLAWTKYNKLTLLAPSYE